MRDLKLALDRLLPADDVATAPTGQNKDKVSKPGSKKDGGVGEVLSMEVDADVEAVVRRKSRPSAKQRRQRALEAAATASNAVPSPNAINDEWADSGDRVSRVDAMVACAAASTVPSIGRGRTLEAKVSRERSPRREGGSVERSGAPVDATTVTTTTTTPTGAGTPPFPLRTDGSKALLHGLRSRPDLIDALVTVLSFHEQTGRYAVQIIGGSEETIRVMPSCLRDTIFG